MYNAHVLQQCPECAGTVSDLAAACPHCGCPSEEIRRVAAVAAASAGGPAEPSSETATIPEAPAARGPAAPAGHRALRASMVLHGLALPFAVALAAEVTFLVGAARFWIGRR